MHRKHNLDGKTADIILDVPSNINRLADLLSGRISNTKTKVGELAEVLTEVGNLQCHSSLGNLQ